MLSERMWETREFLQGCDLPGTVNGAVLVGGYRDKPGCAKSNPGCIQENENLWKRKGLVGKELTHTTAAYSTPRKIIPEGLHLD